MSASRHKLRVGQRVRLTRTGWEGEVTRLLGPAHSAGGALMVRVRWDRSGAEGRAFEARVEPVAG